MIAALFLALFQSSSSGILVLQTGHPGFQPIHDLVVAKNERVATAGGTDAVGSFAVWDAALRQIGWINAAVDKSPRVALSPAGDMVAYSHLQTGYLNIDLVPVSGRLNAGRPSWRFRVGSGYAERDVKPGVSGLFWFGNAKDALECPVAFLSQTQGLLVFRASGKSEDLARGQLVDSKHFLEKDGAAIAACVVPATQELVWLSYDRKRRSDSPPRLWRYHPERGKTSVALTFKEIERVADLAHPWIRMTSSFAGDRFLVANRSNLAIIGERNGVLVAQQGDDNLKNFEVVDAALSPDGDQIALAQSLRPLAGERSEGIEIRRSSDLRLLHRVHRSSAVPGIDPNETLQVTRLAWSRVPAGSVITASSPGKRNLLRVHLNSDGVPTSAREGNSKGMLPSFVRMDSNQRWLAVGSQDRAVTMFDLRTGRPAPVLPPSLGRRAVLDPRAPAMSVQPAANDLEFDATGRYAAFHHPSDGYGIFDLELGVATWVAGLEPSAQRDSQGYPVGFMGDGHACFEFSSPGGKRYRKVDVNGERTTDLGTFPDVRAAAASSSGLHILHVDNGIPQVRHIGGADEGRVVLKPGDAFATPMSSSKRATNPTIVRAAISDDGAYVVTIHNQADSKARDENRYAIWDGRTGQLLGLSFTLRRIELASVATKAVALGLSDGTIFVIAPQAFPVGSVPNNIVATSDRGALVGLTLRQGLSRETVFATHTDGAIVAWDAETLVGSATPDGRATSGSACTIMVTVDRNWAISDPDLRFDAANLGEFPGILWNVGGRGAALNDYADAYYEPGLLVKAIKGQPRRTVGKLREIRSPLAIGWLDRDRFRARLVSEPGQDPTAGRATLLVNGIPRLELNSAQLDELRAGTFSLALADPIISRATPKGETPVIELKAAAPAARLLASLEPGYVDEEGVPRSGSNPPVLMRSAVANALKPRKIAALCIGATVYSDRPLTWADDDAIEMGRLLRQADAQNGSMIQTLVSDPGKPLPKTLVLAALEKWKADALTLGADDTAILYLSGHGRTQALQFEFVLNGAVDSGEALSSAQLADVFVELTRKGCSVNNRALVIDACYSGLANDAFLPLELSANNQGRFYFLGASTSETREYEVLKHGALTFALFDACMESAALFMIDEGVGPRIGLALRSWFLNSEEHHLGRVLKRLNVLSPSVKSISDARQFFAGSIDATQLFGSLRHTGLALVHASGDLDMDRLLATHSDVRSSKLPYFFTKSDIQRPGWKIELVKRGEQIQAELVETDETLRPKASVQAPAPVKSAAELWPWFEAFVRGLQPK